MDLITLYSLTTHPEELIGNDFIPAMLIDEMRYPRMETMEETGEILNDDIAKLIKIMGERDRDVEEFLLEDAYTEELIILYALYVIEGRWPEGEQRLLNNDYGEYIIKYARQVIQDRWPEAEEVLLEQRRPTDLLNYAVDVIQGRWPEAEPILKQSNVWYDYIDELDL